MLKCAQMGVYELIFGENEALLPISSFRPVLDQTIRKMYRELPINRPGGRYVISASKDFETILWQHFSPIPAPNDFDGF